MMKTDDKIQPTTEERPQEIGLAQMLYPQVPPSFWADNYSFPTKQRSRQEPLTLIGVPMRLLLVAVTQITLLFLLLSLITGQ